MAVGLKITALSKDRVEGIYLPAFEETLTSLA